MRWNAATGSTRVIRPRTLASSSSMVSAPAGRPPAATSAGERRGHGVLGRNVQQALASRHDDGGDPRGGGGDQEGAVGAGDVDDLAGERGAHGHASPSAVPIQVNASVTAERGTSTSARVNELISDGETATPASTTNGIITQMSPINARGTVSTVSSARTAASR